ncbi:epsin-1 isoform X3 [Eurosta solidaginis]
MQVNVAGLRRNIKNLAHNYSDAQVKVREATSNDPWGPSATIMAEIADLTYNVVAFSEIMQMIWKRLNDHGKNWRHVYKALILLDYLIKTGTEKVAQQCNENIFAINTLREFVYFEEGKDQGTHVREKAKQLVNLLKDPERLKNERVKALKAKERFAQHPSGFGSDGYIDGPTHRDMPPGWQEEPTKPVSELEMVRPQTAGEEELQLQLAMAMSREEAEQEEAKRRSDDVRLQLALSQSEQDFKDQTVKPTGRKDEQQQSHLLDLLDISLGATSISSPPLGATGGNGDPWGTPARAASQLSDPWSGTSSPQIDPWQPAASMRTATASAPLGAVGGIGSNGGDTWGLTRTQTPSVASGSSTEGWLHSNGGGGATATLNGNSIGEGAIGGVDPWLSKSGPIVAVGGSIGVGGGAVDKVELADPWLTDSIKQVNIAPLAAIAQPSAQPADPWAPKIGIALNDDPWKSTETTAAKKPSPDLDEFDIITNRNKTGDLLTNSSSNASNNNNALLLDELDPLSATNSSLNTTSTNTKKQLKTPQSFLGENSSLVNLDNLIKPVHTQPQAGNAAYNPFSDTVIPPKTNLFQQQQPAVPSINQLKQQQPFAMTINQDPWAPVSNATNASQPSRNYFTTDYDSDVFKSFQNMNGVKNNSTNNNNNNKQTLQYSKSDYDVFNTTFGATNDFYNYNNNNSNSNTSNRLDGPYQFQTQVQVHSQSVDNIRNIQLTTSDSDTEINESTSITTLRQPPASVSANDFKTTATINHHNLQQPATLAPTINQYQTFSAEFNGGLNQNYAASVNNLFSNYNSNNAATLSRSYTFDQSTTNSANLYQQQQPTAPLTTNYSNALTAALADTPGIKITPAPVLASSVSFGSYAAPSNSGGGFAAGSGSAGAVDIGFGSAGGSLFNYGFYDVTPAQSLHTNINTNLTNNNNAMFSASTPSLGNCKLENNNNMPWMNTEAASSSNPFLS